MLGKRSLRWFNFALLLIGCHPSSLPNLSDSSHQDYFSVQFKNDTRGTFPDNQVFIQFVGFNGPALAGRSNSVVTINLRDQSDALGSIGDQVRAEVDKPLPFFTLADLKNSTLRLPQKGTANDENGKFYGTRVFISLGTPIKTLRVAPDGKGFAQPTYSENDPDINTIFDWVEFTYDPYNSAEGLTPVTFGGNTTQVDQFGIPLWISLSGDKGSSAGPVGTQLRSMTSPIPLNSRAEIIQRFIDTASNDFKTLVQGESMGQPARIISPVKSAHFKGQAANYFDSYVDEVWSFYKRNPLRYCDTYHENSPQPHSGNCFEGQVNGSDEFSFYKINAGATEDCTLAKPCFMKKPSTQNVFENSGTLAGGGINYNAFGAQFAAALNRHVATIQYNDGYAHWLDSDLTFYYPARPANEYSQFWHSIGINHLAYGMGYDDVGGTGPLVYVNAPGEMLGTLTIGIGW